MTSQRMSDSEILERVTAVDERLRAGLADIRGDLMGLTMQVKETNGRVRQHDLVQAEQRGGMRVLMWIAGVAVGIPSTVGATVGVVVALRALLGG